MRHYKDNLISIFQSNADSVSFQFSSSLQLESIYGMLFDEFQIQYKQVQHRANKIVFRLLEHTVLFTVSLLCRDLTCGLLFTHTHTTCCRPESDCNHLIEVSIWVPHRPICLNGCVDYRWPCIERDPD